MTIPYVEFTLDEEWNEQDVLSSVLVASLIIAVYWFVNQQFKRYCHRLSSKKPFGEKIPMPPDSHWLFGHVWFIGRIFDPKLTTTVTTSSPLDDVCDKHCDPIALTTTNEHGQFSYWLLKRRVLVVTSVEDARTILHTEYNRVTPPIITKHVHMLLGYVTSAGSACCGRFRELFLAVAAKE